jgi:dolichol-phosphate mannosyltransferase
LNILSAAGIVLLVITAFLVALQIIARLLFPEAAPKGATTVLIAILFFGSLNLFAVGLVGEYLAKVFEEVKRRPHFIRRSVIKEGEVRFASVDEKPPVSL